MRTRRRPPARPLIPRLPAPATSDKRWGRCFLEHDSRIREQAWSENRWPAPLARGRLFRCFGAQEPAAMEEFYRIRRLPPYVFEQVNRAKAAARNAGADIIDLGMGNPDL